RSTTAVQNRINASSVHTRCRSVLRTAPKTVRHSAGVMHSCSRSTTRSRSIVFARLGIAPPRDGGPCPQGTQGVAIYRQIILAAMILNAAPARAIREFTTEQHPGGAV